MSYTSGPYPGSSPGPEQQTFPPQAGMFAAPYATSFNAGGYTNMPPTMAAQGPYTNVPVYPGHAPWGGYYNTPQMGTVGWQQQAQVLQPMQQGFEDSHLYTGWVGVNDENENGEKDKGKETKKDKTHSKMKKKNKQVNSDAQFLGSTLPGAFPAPGQGAPSVVHQANVGKKKSSAHRQYSHSDDNSDGDASLGRANSASPRATLVSEVPLHPGGSGRIVVRCETTMQQPGKTSNANVPQQRRGGHNRRGHESDSDTDSTDTDTDTDTGFGTPEPSPSRVVRSPPAATHAMAAGDAMTGAEIVPVPAITAFAVSARRMRQTARNWTRFCGASSGFGGFGGPSSLGGYTDACHLTVRDPAAVLGLYRMLEVLHTGVPVSQAAIRKSFSPASSSSTPPPPAFPSLPPSPVVLPPRVLAYVVMFGLEFGALDLNTNDSKKQQQQHKHLMPPPRPGSMHQHQQHQQAQPQNQPPPLPNLLRTRISGWLDAFAYSVGSTSKGKTPAASASENTGPLARDWPYVLYVARVLGHRALFAACVRLLLENWGPLVEDEGVGAARLAELAPAMQGVVVRDMGCLRATRMRAVETIVGQAMQTFPSTSM